MSSCYICHKNVHQENAFGGTVFCDNCIKKPGFYVASWAFPPNKLVLVHADDASAAAEAYVFNEFEHDGTYTLRVIDAQWKIFKITVSVSTITTVDTNILEAPDAG